MNTLTFLLSTVIELYTMVLWCCYYASGCSGLIVIFTTPSHSL